VGENAVGAPLVGGRDGAWTVIVPVMLDDWQCGDDMKKNEPMLLKVTDSEAPRVSDPKSGLAIGTQLPSAFVCTTL